MKTQPIRISSYHFSFILAIITLLSFGVSICTINAGYDAVCANLIYIPIILACFFYTWRGFFFSLLLSAGYLLLVIVSSRDILLVEQALVRVVFFLIVAGVITILTQYQTKTSKKLARIENQYNSLFEAMLEGFAYCKIVYDDKKKPCDFIYLKVNTAFEKLTGLTKVEGKYASEISHELSTVYPELFGIYKKVARTGQHETIEITLKPGNVLVSVSVYCTQKGFFLAVYNNITGRRKTEDALKESKTRITQIVSHIPVPLCYVSDDNVIEFLNSRFIQTFGYSHLDLPTLFALWERAFPDEMYRQWVKHTWEKSLKIAREAGKDIESAEYTITCQNGDLRVVEISGIAIENHVLVTFVDFTDRRHAEETIREANQKLRFLTGITRHDIFNQLNAMYLYLDMALEETETGLIHDYIRRVQNSGKRIEAITGFTREFEHFGTGSSGWQNVNQIIEAAKTEIPTGIITITTIISDDLEIYADPIIRKVFTTLFDNAIRHGGRDISKIQLSTMRSDSILTIICRDDGTGVIASEKEKIFANGFGKNTGIGLFLSREILAINDFSIIENGVEGKGACFEILIPAGKFRSMVPDL